MNKKLSLASICGSPNDIINCSLSSLVNQNETLNILCRQIASPHAACKSFRAHDENHMFAGRTDRLDRFDDRNVPDKLTCAIITSRCVPVASSAAESRARALARYFRKRIFSRNIFFCPPGSSFLFRYHMNLDNKFVVSLFTGTTVRRTRAPSSASRR